MMPKRKTHQEVLALIQEAIVKEELAIPLYVSHIQQAFFWSGLEEDTQKKIVERLHILESESRGHVEMLRQVEGYYQKSQ